MPALLPAAQNLCRKAKALMVKFVFFFLCQKEEKNEYRYNLRENRRNHKRFAWLATLYFSAQNVT